MEEQNPSTFAPSKERIRAFLQRTKQFQSENSGESAIKAKQSLTLNPNSSKLSITGAQSLPSHSPRSIQGNSFNFSKISHGGPSSMKITHRFLEDKKGLLDGNKIIEFQMEEEGEDSPTQNRYPPFYSQPAHIDISTQPIAESNFSSRQRVESDMTSRATSPINLQTLEQPQQIGYIRETTRETPTEKNKDKFLGLMKSYARGRDNATSPVFKPASPIGGRTERLKLTGLYPGSLKARSKSPAFNKLRSGKLGLKGSSSQLLPTTKEILQKKRSNSKLKNIRSKSKENSPSKRKKSQKAGKRTTQPTKSLEPSKSQNSFLMHEVKYKKPLFKGEEEIKPIQRVQHNISLASMEQDLALLNGGSGRIQFSQKGAIRVEESSKFKSQETAKFKENFQSEKRKNQSIKEKPRSRDERTQQSQNMQLNLIESQRIEQSSYQKEEERTREAAARKLSEEQNKSEEMKKNLPVLEDQNKRMLVQYISIVKKKVAQMDEKLEEAKQEIEYYKRRFEEQQHLVRSLQETESTMNMKYGIIITQNQELTDTLERKKTKISNLKEKLGENVNFNFQGRMQNIGVSVTSTAISGNTPTPDSSINQPVHGIHLNDQLKVQPLAPKSDSFLLLLKHFGLEPFSFYKGFKGESELRNEQDFLHDMENIPGDIPRFLRFEPQQLAFIQTISQFYKYEQHQRLRTEEQSFKMIQALQENAMKLEGQIRHYKKQKGVGENQREQIRSHSSSAIVKGAFLRIEGSPTKQLRDSPGRPISQAQITYNIRKVGYKESETNSERSGSVDLAMKKVDSNSSLDTLNFKMRQLSIINEQDISANENSMIYKQKKPSQSRVESECSPMLASPVVSHSHKYQR